jgi:hypothetical protein
LGPRSSAGDLNNIRNNVPPTAAGDNSRMAGHRKSNSTRQMNNFLSNENQAPQMVSSTPQKNLQGKSNKMVLNEQVLDK